MAARSGQRPRCTAATIPAGTAMSSATSMAATVSAIVTGKRARIAPVTDSLLNSDVPRSPCRAEPAQVKYWTSTGSLSPSRSRVASICSAVAFSPAIVIAGSPGIIRTSANTPSETRNSNGMITKIRLSVYCSTIPTPSPCVEWARGKTRPPRCGR